MSEDFEFSTDPARIDRAKVHHWIGDLSYWAQGRPRETQDAAIDASRNYGVYDPDGRQVAYARVVTDNVTFAWMCDVFVDPEARGRGVGTMLIAGVIADLEPLNLKRTALATADAHGLYERFGFTSLEDPQRWMSRSGG